MDRDGGFSFKFGRDDRRGDVEGKRASWEVYARIAVVQAEAASRFRCGLRGPAWVADAKPHFQWCRYVPRRKIAEEQRSRADDCSAASTSSAISMKTIAGVGADRLAGRNPSRSLPFARRQRAPQRVSSAARHSEPPAGSHGPAGGCLFVSHDAQHAFRN